MRRLLIVSASLAFAGLPAVALANAGDQQGDQNRGDVNVVVRHQSGDGNLGDEPPFGAARAAANSQCLSERARIGLAAFRAKYGPRHAFRHCVAARLPADRAAAQQCVAERKAIGVAAFRAKYGLPHALRRCVLAKTGP